jgi:hypothetical protein
MRYDRARVSLDRNTTYIARPPSSPAPPADQHRLTFGRRLTRVPERRSRRSGAISQGAEPGVRGVDLRVTFDDRWRVSSELIGTEPPARRPRHLCLNPLREKQCIASTP